MICGHINNTAYWFSGSENPYIRIGLLNYFNRPAGGNNVFANNSDVMLTAAFKQDGTADWNPVAGSPALTGGDFTAAKVSNSFFTPTTYRGAAAQGDTWWKTWTRFF